VTNGLKFEDVCKKNGALFDFSYALRDSLWTKRPMQEFGNVWTLDEKYSGESTENKIAKVFSEMEKKRATDFFLSKLDDIMWLFNLRGCDIKCNPVAYSYAHFSDGKILLFLKNGAFATEISDYFQRIVIETRDYETIDDYLKKQAEHNNEKRRILLDYSARASLEIYSGELYSKAKAALLINSGSAEIYGGKISSQTDCAIENFSTLTVSGSPDISSEKYSVITDKPIAISSSAGELSSPISVKYLSEFKKGLKPRCSGMLRQDLYRRSRFTI
jgi:hypothetical protein